MDTSTAASSSQSQSDIFLVFREFQSKKRSFLTRGLNAPESHAKKKKNVIKTKKEKTTALLLHSCSRAERAGCSGDFIPTAPHTFYHRCLRGVFKVKPGVAGRPL